MEEEKDSTLEEVLRAILESEQRLRSEMRGNHAESQASYVELAEAIHTLSTNTDQQFADMRTSTDQQFADVRRDMATKDFVDRKVDGAETKVVTEVRRVDGKVGRLIDVLEKKDVLTVRDAHKIIVGE